MNHKLNNETILPNFEEEFKGFTKEEAIMEANKCLNCKKPLCREGCPVNNNIPCFIQKIKEADFNSAYRIISEASNLPAICGRVCAHEKQCQGSCILGKKGKPVMISKLERFVADHEEEYQTTNIPSTMLKDQKVAVIGSGPAGLSAAGDLARMGYEVTVFEAEDTPGGVLTYGIPEYRLPKVIVNREITKLKNLGIEFKTNTVIGEDISLDGLYSQGFEAIFIASGAGSPRKSDIRGVYLPGVYYANYFLATVNLVNIGKLRKEEIPILPGDNVAVIGAGNVAMDAARTCKRLGAKNVYIVYRRDYNSIPAINAELNASQEEGVEILCYTNPVKILGTTRVTGIKCTKSEVNNQTGQINEISNSDFTLDVNRVILAIGQRPRSRIVSSTNNLSTNAKGYVVTSKDVFGHTSKDGVFAGGDVVTEPATVVSAMKQGKLIANEIDKYLKAKKEQ